MFRAVLSRGLLASLAVLSWASFASAVPLVISHQGRLLDASDHPLSGMYTIIYSIHDAAVGGSQLWLEDHVGVVVTDGLFSVVLGSTVPLTADIVAGNGGGGGGGAIRFLQVQIAGQPPISPRTPLSSSPYSVASQRVSGDIQTLPGEMIIHCTACSAVDGITLSSDVDSDDLSMVRLNGLPPGTPYIGRVAVSSSSSQSSIALGDLDADGALDMHCGPDSTVFDMGSGDNGTVVSSYRAKAGKTGATKRMSYSSGGSTFAIGEDCNDGGAEMRVLNTASSNNQGWSLRCKPDSIVNEERISDGRADVVLYKATTGKTGRAKQSLFMVPGGGTTESDEDCNATGSSLKLRFDSSPARISTNMTVGKQSSRIILEADLDGDGLAENSCASTSDSTHTGVSVSSRFGSGPRQTTSMDGSFSHSRMRCDSDSDDDGLADNSVVSDASPSGSSLRVLSLNGLPPGEPVIGTLRMASTPSSATLEIGDLDGDGLYSILSTADSVVKELTVTDNGGGGVTLMKAKEKANRTKCGSNLRAMSPTSTNEIDGSCDVASAKHAINTKGTGTSGRSISSSTNMLLASHVVDADDDGDGHSERSVVSSADTATAQVMAEGGDVQVLMKVVNKGAIKGGINVMQANRAVVGFDSDGMGYLDSTLGIGVVPTHRIDVAGGAYCDGTNWVNASDKNSKENFRKIDGEEILEKISDLEITRWNYKGDKAAEHIGPTAQDFKKTFGVGADDRSISTIDPSGIALAAIKELYKQFSSEMKQKDDQIEQLQREMKKLREELKKKN